VLTGIGWYSGSPFSDRLSSDVSVNEESIEIRQELWEANWRMFQDSPYLGIGPGQNLSRLEEYYQKAEVEYGVIDRAHNNILEHLAGQGLFVASFYLIFSGYFLWTAYCLSVRQDADRFVKSIGAGSLCAQVYFHILGLVDSNFFDQEVKNIVVWVWALTAAAYGRNREPAVT
jgi:O-antigen ligase